MRKPTYKQEIIIGDGLACIVNNSPFGIKGLSGKYLGEVCVRKKDRITRSSGIPFL